MLTPLLPHGVPEIDGDLVSLAGRGRDRSDIKLASSLYWLQSGRLLTCCKCIHLEFPISRLNSSICGEG